MSDLPARLAALGAATVCDARGGLGLIGSGLVRISGEGAVCGRAVTAAAGSMPALRDALLVLERGDVLCVAAAGDRACLGDLLVSELIRLRAAAVVVDGLVRDRARLRGLGLTVFARGVTPRAGHSREEAGTQVRIAVGETVVSPGDWIVGDDDGTVAVPPGEAEDVLRRGRAMVARDERALSAVAAGTSLFEAWAEHQTESGS